MDREQAIRHRHSVRQYTDRPIEGETLELLQSEIERINAESGLRIRLILGESKAFSGVMTRMTKFKGAVNYLAIIGPDTPDLNMRAGYYGEQLVLFAQEIGLNTCWALFCGKKGCREFVGSGERMAIGISVGYGENQGAPHRSKTLSDVSDTEDIPEWFVKGAECALLAPTSMNRQAFRFSYMGDNRVRLTGASGTAAAIDLGIVKYHFEFGSGKTDIEWSD